MPGRLLAAGPPPMPLTISGLAFDDPALEAGVRAGLAATEELLARSVVSDYPFVTQTSRHLVEAGGKRFRPLVVLLASQFGSPEAPGVIPAAVAIELTHLSTLYHDDVMDEALLRRGAASANARWSNTIAILTGDFLFARASEITADLGSEATRILARTIAVLCEGQIKETVGPHAGEDVVAHYLGVLADKTGSLIATSGRLGALLAGAPPEQVEILARYGELIGVAFQLSDDLLDVAAAPGESGKLPGTDLRQGVRTLPLLHVLADGGPAAARLRELLAGPIATADGLDEALDLVRTHAGMARARATLVEWTDRARAVLADLPDSPVRDALDALAAYVVTRSG